MEPIKGVAGKESLRDIGSILSVSSKGCSRSCSSSSSSSMMMMGSMMGRVRDMTYIISIMIVVISNHIYSIILKTVTFAFFRTHRKKAMGEPRANKA